MEIARFLQMEGAVTSTQDKYNRVPLSYLPQSAKRIGVISSVSFAIALAPPHSHYVMKCDTLQNIKMSHHSLILFRRRHA